MDNNLRRASPTQPQYLQRKASTRDAMDNDLHRAPPTQQPMELETTDEHAATSCTYTTIPSLNTRAVKSRGDLHASCETLRKKANNGQQSYTATKARTLDTAATSSSPDTVMLCKYVYKPCFNPRTLKRNGELHSLCAEHQAKANSCQKQYAKKKRKLSKTMKAQANGKVDGSMPPTDTAIPTEPSAATRHPHSSSAHDLLRSMLHPASDMVPRFPPLPPPLPSTRSYKAISLGLHDSRSSPVGSGSVQGSYSYPRLPPVPSLQSLFPSAPSPVHHYRLPFGPTRPHPNNNSHE